MKKIEDRNAERRSSNEKTVCTLKDSGWRAPKRPATKGKAQELHVTIDPHVAAMVRKFAMASGRPVGAVVSGAIKLSLVSALADKRRMPGDGWTIVEDYVREAVFRQPGCQNAFNRTMRE